MAKKFKPEAWIPIKLKTGKYAIVPLKSAERKTVDNARHTLLREGVIVGVVTKTRKGAIANLKDIGASKLQQEKVEVVRMGWWFVRGDITE
jgi:hypothetical protein